jgi:hypothetical protein
MTDSLRQRLITTLGLMIADWQFRSDVDNPGKAPSPELLEAMALKAELEAVE